MAARKLFLILPQQSSAEEVGEFVKQEFQNCSIQLENRETPAWIVATPPDRTPAQISNQVFTPPTQDGKTGLVLQIADYFGFESKELWQQLQVWLQNDA